MASMRITKLPKEEAWIQTKVQQLGVKKHECSQVNNQKYYELSGSPRSLVVHKHMGPPITILGVIATQLTDSVASSNAPTTSSNN